jgi:hypothetical protein
MSGGAIRYIFLLYGLFRFILRLLQ